MNVVHSGDTYQIYGEALKTYNNLPVGTYEINFSKFTGFFLTAHTDLSVSEERIYGSSPAKVEKVLRGFEVADRNFGVILSGKKGIGKSLFARQLAIRAKEIGLPFIIVSNYIPGIASFISSIEQEVIILFDEFEKTFSKQESCDPQEEMLSLFDGIDGGKKLFIITCNEVRQLNSYLLNRPGRFHYHFILSNPNPDEIREYMNDKLKEEYHPLIKKIINFSMSVDLTYDILRAIAFELNMGYSFEETLMDLNISKESAPKYNMIITFSDGSIRTIENEKIDTYSGERKFFWIRNTRNDDAIRISFIPSNIIIDSERSEMMIDPENVSLYVDEDYYDFNNPAEKARYEALTNLQIKKMVFVRNQTSEYMYKYLA